MPWLERNCLLLFGLLKAPAIYIYIINVKSSISLSCSLPSDKMCTLHFQNSLIWVLKKHLNLILSRSLKKFILLQKTIHQKRVVSGIRSADRWLYFPVTDNEIIDAAFCNSALWDEFIARNLTILFRRPFHQFSFLMLFLLNCIYLYFDLSYQIFLSHHATII